MKRFEWRLERVLQIKTKQEQALRADLLRLAGRLAQTKGELLTQKAKLQEIISSIAQSHPRKRLHKKEFFLEYSKASDQQIRKLQEAITDLERLQKEKIAEVLRVKRFKEGLEKLRDKALREFIKEQEKIEQGQLDDVAGVSFIRKQGPVVA